MHTNDVFEELNKEGIQTELVQLAGKLIEPCKACFACGGQKNCVHRKDQFYFIDGNLYVLQHLTVSDKFPCML